MATITKSATATNASGTISYTFTYTITTSNTTVTLSITKGAWTKVTGTGVRGQIFINNNRITYQTIYPANTANSGSQDYSLTVNMTRGTVARTYPLRLDLDEVSGTSSSPSYISKGSTTIDVTVPALQSYAVTYNANGYGTAPAAQTKYYGQDLTLQPAMSADGVSFVKWNTNAAGTGTSYNGGATYTSNAALTLYAVWKKIISSVSVGKTTAIRVADATSTEEAGEGTYAYLTVPYTVSGQASASVSINVTVDSEDPTVTFSPSSATKTETGTPLTGTIVARASGCAVDKKYVFTVTISATNTVSGATQTTVVATRSIVLASAYFVMDVKAKGKGIHFGGSAVDDGFWVSMSSHFAGDGIYQHGFISCRKDAETLSSNTVVGRHQHKDSEGLMCFYSETIRTTANQTYTSFIHRRYDASGTGNTSHGFYLRIDNDGTLTVTFPSTTSRDAWASGLNVVKKDGDTMTGSLTLKSTHLTSNTTVSTNSWSRSLIFTDSENAEIGRVGVYFNTGGSQYTALRNTRSISGSNVHNELDLIVRSNGDRAIAVSDATIWRNALGASSGVWPADLIGSLAASKITSGTLALARGGTASDNTARSINTVFAGPSSGSAGNASWRKLVAADIPNISTDKLTSGILGIARGGTGTSTGVKGWTKIVDGVNNTTAKTIDVSSYTDIAVCVYKSTSYRSGVIIPKAFLSTSLCELYLGGWGTNASASNRRGYCKISTTQFQAGGVRIDGTETTGTWYVYGR